VPVGYCRTSTADQNPGHRIDALLTRGVRHATIHIDIAGGAKTFRP
jgi:DNA invertase Pin-like site-specific DNA recombinase